MSNTFIAKRYSLTQQAYVDSRNIRIVQPVVRYPQCSENPSVPPKTGSPFLVLPTELRLQIYGYLTDGDVSSLDQIRQTCGLSAPSTTFAYLYRSPGRCTKPPTIPKEAVSLFHVCRLIREELIDACFHDRPFILEASLYRRDAGGLYVIPPNPGPVAWIRKLVLMTAFEGNGIVKGVGDLRPIQQMTNLKILYIGFFIVFVKSGIAPLDHLRRPDNVLEAVLECVPKNTAVHFEFDARMAEQLSKEILDRQYRGYSFGMHGVGPCIYRNCLIARLNDIVKLSSRMGRLSGSVVNHSLCEYPTCQEGLDCVNSANRMLMKETELPVSGTLSSNGLETVEARKNDHASTALGVTNEIRTKRCVHGHTWCTECEKGLVQKLKKWSGQVFKH